MQMTEKIELTNCIVWTVQTNIDARVGVMWAQPEKHINFFCLSNNFYSFMNYFTF